MRVYSITTIQDRIIYLKKQVCTMYITQTIKAALEQNSIVGDEYAYMIVKFYSLQLGFVDESAVNQRVGDS